MGVESRATLAAHVVTPFLTFPTLGGKEPISVNSTSRRSVSIDAPFIEPENA